MDRKIASRKKKKIPLAEPGVVRVITRNGGEEERRRGASHRNPIWIIEIGKVKSKIG